MDLALLAPVLGESTYHGTGSDRIMGARHQIGGPKS